MIRAYSAPKWVSSVEALSPPKHQLAHLAHPQPTPIVRLHLPASLAPPDFRVWIKRDDYTGSELSGNKVRKLRFLLAEAVLKQADTVITAGGEQSNHARATALSARSLGMEPHIVLRTDTSAEEVGLVGNLLLDRLAGAKIYLATKAEWRKYGSDALIAEVASKLRQAGRNPYPIPVGGSDGLGTWGYIDAVAELESQILHSQAHHSTNPTPAASNTMESSPIMEEVRERMMGGVPEQLPRFSDVAVATGSGGTTGGIALGLWLSRHGPLRGPKLHGFSVCDSPKYFYKYINQRVIGNMVRDDVEWEGRPVAEEMVHITDVQGLGYAQSTTEELQTILQIARSTGLVFDPVYSGKAMCGLLRAMREQPQDFAGRDVLFWHTGGLLGVFDKADQIQSMLDPTDIRPLPLPKL